MTDSTSSRRGPPAIEERASAAPLRATGAPPIVKCLARLLVAALVLGCAAAFGAQGRVTVTVMARASPVEVRTCELQGGCGAGTWTDYE